MNTTPHAAAVRAEASITARFDGGDFDSAKDGELAKLIHAEYSALIEAAEELFRAEESGSFAHMSHAKAQLRAELARVKGGS